MGTTTNDTKASKDTFIQFYSWHKSNNKKPTKSSGTIRYQLRNKNSISLPDFKTYEQENS